MKPEVEPAPIWKVFLGGMVFLSLVGITAAAAPGEVIIAAVAFSPIVSALLIREIVRAVNRRDDPRNAKMPDDSP